MFSQQPRLRRCRTPVAVHQNSSIRLTYRQLERRVNKSRWVINGIAKYQCLEKKKTEDRVQMYQPEISI